MQQPLTAAATAAAIMGFVPIIVSFIRAERLPERTAAALAFLVCLAAAVLTTFLTDGFLTGDGRGPAELAKLYIINLVACIVVARGTYAAVWRPMGVARRLERAGPQLGAEPIALDDETRADADPAGERAPTHRSP